LKKIEFNLQEIFFLLILVVISVGFFSIIRPFLVDIFLAIVLAILFNRPYAYFCRKFKEKNSKAALLTILIVFFTIVIPVSFITMMVSKEVSSTYDAVKVNWPAIQEYFNHLPEKASSVPVVKDYIDEIDWNAVAEWVNKSYAAIAEFALGLIQKTFINVGFMIVHFFIVLFLLYFLFIDGKKMIERIQYLIPLKDTEERELIDKLKQVTDAIIFNTFMLAFLEGAFGGILFAILGIPSPFFWGMIMTFLSIIPIVGTNSILVPMAIFQIAIGNIWTGIIILVIGTGTVAVNQNIIRPRLDGYKSGMHPAIMFVASMGGLIVMGIVGFLAGPMIAGLFIVMWNLFGNKYKNKLEKYNLGDESTQ
jgi:predicted PurR-regulated permease PerM